LTDRTTIEGRNGAFGAYVARRIALQSEHAGALVVVVMRFLLRAWWPESTAVGKGQRRALAPTYRRAAPVTRLSLASFGYRRVPISAPLATVCGGCRGDRRGLRWFASGLARPAWWPWPVALEWAHASYRAGAFRVRVLDRGFRVVSHAAAIPPSL